MVLNLKQIYDTDGEKADLDFVVGSDKLAETDRRSFPEGAHVKGSVFNRAGIVTLRGTAEALLKTSCDRCLKEIEADFSFDIRHNLVRSLNNEDNDDYVVTEGDELDLDELVYADILLQLPTKLLCSENCKGLCPVCGADLNVAACSCGRPAV